MTTPIAAFRRRRIACCLVLGLLVSLVGCDKSSTPEQDAEAQKTAELKARLDALADKAEALHEDAKRMTERANLQKDIVTRRFGELLAETDGQPASSDTGIGDTSPRPGREPWKPGDSSPRFTNPDSPLHLPGVIRADDQVLAKVETAVAGLGGKVVKSTSSLIVCDLPDHGVPWNATHKNGSLTISQMLTEVPDDPALRKAIRDFANSSRHSSTIRFTSSFQPNGSKLWYLETARVLPQTEFVRTGAIAEHVAGVAQDQRALFDYIAPHTKSHPAAPQPAPIADREPTEAEMLRAMRNHPAYRAGNGSFTLTGVKKTGCKRLSAYKYRCVYIPQTTGDPDSLTGALIELTPRGENLAVFTYAGGQWHFSGAE